MEHILISPGKLKLMLSRSDMERYELDSVTAGTQDQVTRGALRELFSDLKQKTGFDASSDRVFVQMYPSKDGGAELYITRLGGRTDEQKENGTVHLSGAAVFYEMSALLESCADITRRGEPTSSSAWLGNGRYYLLWEDDVEYGEYLRGARREQLSDAIGERGALLYDSAASFYIREYCRCFCPERAISTLGELA